MVPRHYFCGCVVDTANYISDLLNGAANILTTLAALIGAIASVVVAVRQHRQIGRKDS